MALAVIDAGHFATERPAAALLSEYLTRHFPSCRASAEEEDRSCDCGMRNADFYRTDRTNQTDLSDLADQNPQSAFRNPAGWLALQRNTSNIDRVQEDRYFRRKENIMPETGNLYPYIMRQTRQTMPALSFLQERLNRC